MNKVEVEDKVEVCNLYSTLKSESKKKNKNKNNNEKKNKQNIKISRS